MRNASLLLAPLAALLSLAACQTPTIQIPEADQQRSERELSGQQRFLRVATFIGPLWDDTRKAFLTDRPASEIDLVQKPSGKPIAPPAFERVLPPGTPVKIVDVEFPGTFMLSQRVLVTPRYHPWVYLQIPGEKRPGILVLPQEVKSSEDVRVELERYLTADDPRPALAALSPVVLKKEAGPGMSPRALEMAWGLPERKRIDRPAGTEEWSWDGGKRRAWLRDERVEKVER